MALARAPQRSDVLPRPSDESLVDDAAGASVNQGGVRDLPMPTPPKHADVFEALTLSLGWTGAHWLYLGKSAPLFTRCFHLASSVVLLMTGAMVVHVPIAAAGLAFFGFVIALWLRDYLHHEHHFAEYQRQLARKVTPENELERQTVPEFHPPERAEVA